MMWGVRNMIHICPSNADYKPGTWEITAACWGEPICEYEIVVEELPQLPAASPVLHFFCARLIFCSKLVLGILYLPDTNVLKLRRNTSFTLRNTLLLCILSITLLLLLAPTSLVTL